MLTNDPRAVLSGAPVSRVENPGGDVVLSYESLVLGTALHNQIQSADTIYRFKELTSIKQFISLDNMPT